MPNPETTPNAHPEVLWERTIYRRAKAYVHRYGNGSLALIYAVVGGKGGCRKFDVGEEETAIDAGIAWMSDFERHIEENAKSAGTDASEKTL